MEENIDVSSADSSSASTELADSSQATTQPVEPTQPEPPFHQHPRFRELTTQNRELKQQIAQIQQWQREQQQRQQAQSQPQDGPLTQEEQAAITALKRLMARDPELATALMAGKQLPQFQQRFQGIDQMQQQAARAHYNASKSVIKEMAAAENLPTDEANLQHIARLVAGAALALENGDERYKNGDMAVLQEAFDNVKGFLGALRKPAENSLIQTKNKLKQLPKPAQGSAPGQPALPKPVPGKEREYEQTMHSMARKMLLEG